MQSTEHTTQLKPGEKGMNRVRDPAREAMPQTITKGGYLDRFPQAPANPYEADWIDLESLQKQEEAKRSDATTMFALLALIVASFLSGTLCHAIVVRHSFGIPIGQQYGHARQLTARNQEAL